MRQTAIVTKIVLLLAALGCGLPNAHAADPGVRGEVRTVTITLDPSDDPAVAIYLMKFDLRLENRSTEPVNIPKSAAGGHETVVLLGLQTERPDGSWMNLIQATWLGDATTKYEACVSVPAAATAEIGGVHSGFVLLEKGRKDLGSEPTVRLNLMLLCQLPDGKVLNTSVTTEAFSIRLPIQPK